MNHETLISGYRKVVHTIYSPKYYYARVKKFLKEYKPMQAKTFHFRFSHLGSGFQIHFPPGDNRKGENLLLEAFSGLCSAGPGFFRLQLPLRFMDSTSERFSNAACRVFNKKSYLKYSLPLGTFLPCQSSQSRDIIIRFVALLRKML